MPDEAKFAEIIKLLPDEAKPIIKSSLLKDIKVGDAVVRYLAGVIAMNLYVLKITPALITCGAPEFPGADWTFDPKTGSEIDEDLGWGPPPKRTGSYIIPKTAVN